MLRSFNTPHFTLTVFLLFDALILVYWFAVLVYLLAIDPASTEYNVYRDMHKVFLTHTVTTFRLLYLWEAHRKNRPVRWRAWWTGSLLLFSTVMDVCNLVRVWRYMVQDVYDMWAVQLSLGVLFLLSSVVVCAWFLMRSTAKNNNE